MFINTRKRYRFMAQAQLFCAVSSSLSGMLWCASYRDARQLWRAGKPGNDFAISYSPKTKAEADEVISKLAVDGEIGMEMNETLWGLFFRDVQGQVRRSLDVERRPERQIESMRRSVVLARRSAARSLGGGRICDRVRKTPGSVVHVVRSDCDCRLCDFSRLL